jgi:sodium/proline symporter
MMLLVAVLLPLAAVAAVGGPGDLMTAVITDPTPSPVAQPTVLLSAVFAAGLFGIGLGYPGQPHVVNRFMALGSASAIARGRRIALAWAAVIYTGMILLGWCGRLLLPALADHESVLLALGATLLPAAVGGVVAGGVLAAIMSTSDSQLLVAGGAVAVALALLVPESIFARVLFAWQVLGNAFGPLLLVLLWRGPVAPALRLAAMATGAGLTILLSFAPDAPGDAAERLLPFLAALGLALAGVQRGAGRARTAAS